mmetsp:Transcript_20812/g.53107  ORF Transcript_20812/g.53107 Transcript_20812/m.53107 type:complete len:215 (+) Transcript_20812:422-1066(+)
MLLLCASFSFSLFNNRTPRTLCIESRLPLPNMRLLNGLLSSGCSNEPKTDVGGAPVAAPKIDPPKTDVVPPMPPSTERPFVLECDWVSDFFIEDFLNVWFRSTTRSSLLTSSAWTYALSLLCSLKKESFSRPTRLGNSSASCRNSENSMVPDLSASYLCSRSAVSGCDICTPSLLSAMRSSAVEMKPERSTSNCSKTCRSRTISANSSRLMQPD